MKLSKIFLLIAASVAFFLSSCTKEGGISFESPSYGDLVDSSGNCRTKFIEGVYNAGVTFTRDNYIDVFVFIDSVGTFEIKTDTVNGVSFFGKGKIGERGENRVRIYGSGRPLSGGTFVFTVQYKDSRCKVPIKFDGTVIPPAVYTLETETGGCAGAVLDGTFSTNIATTDANKVTLKVNVTTAGTYTITTPSVNGVTFSGSGAFTTTGAHTIVLKASGVPAAVGAFNYSVTHSGATCTYSVTVEKGPDAAVFTLGGGPGACSGFVAAGTYKVSTALTASNTISCKVNVSAIGAYAITSNKVNGISFSASGTFTATGEQTVVLTGTGTPEVAGVKNYTLTAGASTCTFSVTAEAVTTTPPTVSTNFYFKATINSKNLTYTVNSPSNIIGGLVDYSHADPLTDIGEYGYGFSISDFDKRDTNDISLYIVKDFASLPSQANQLSIFRLGNYNYFSGTATVEVALINYIDENGEGWTSNGNQTGSTFSITELVNAPTDLDGVKIFTAKFSCKLYSVIDSRSINLVNGEMRGVVISR